RKLAGNAAVPTLLCQNTVMSSGRVIKLRKPPLTVPTILGWVDAHYARTGRWPKPESGLIPGSGGETWQAVHSALGYGGRGLDLRLTLPQFLAKHRNVPSPGQKSRLSKALILSWADEHFRCTGKWPNVNSGAVQGASGENWSAIAGAMYRRSRGLRG